MGWWWWWWWWFFGRLEENGVGVMGVGREGFRGFVCVCVCVCEEVGRLGRGGGVDVCFW